MNVIALLLADSRFPGGGHVHSGGLEEAAARGLVRTEADLPAFLRHRLRTAGALAAVFAAAAARPAPDWLSLDAELDARTPSAAQRAASRAQGRATARAARAMVTESAQAPEPPEPVRESHSFAEGPPVLNATGGDRRFRAVSLGEPVRESHWLAEGAPDVNATGGDRQFRVVRDGRRDAVAGLLAVVARPHHALILGALVGVPLDAALAAAYLAVSGPASASVRLLGLDPLLVNAIVADLAADIAAVAGDAGLDRDPADLPAPGSPGLDVLAEEHDRHHREEVRLFVS
jgi:urease accessory protein